MSCWAVIVGGHTHVQMLRRHRETMVVNAGSVGEPFAQMPFVGRPRIYPWAEYAVIDWANQAIGVELRRAPLDVDTVKERSSTSGMPYLTDYRCPRGDREGTPLQQLDRSIHQRDH